MLDFENCAPQDVMELTATELIDDEFIAFIQSFGITGDKAELAQREQYKSYAVVRAQECGIEPQFKRLYNAAERAQKAAIKAEKERFKAQQESENALKYANDWRSQLRTDRNGFATTVDNFLTILRNDAYFKGIQFNLLSYSPEIRDDDGRIRRWTDAQDSEMRRYIESTYSIHSLQKSDDALRVRFTEKEYHPVRDYISSLQWDGVDRISQFFQFTVKAEDTPYIREASRLIFAGGINRAFHPGCKFDEMIVLVGTKQGEGKSTLVRWIAMQDEWFGEVSEIEGQKGIEALEGKWILEVAELLAMVRAKEAEAQKAFVTRQVDRYRHPFDKRVTEHPRQCIFIGTTNKAQFLTDKTGNRRYFPVQIKQSGYDMYARESEIKEYIQQCWAEAYAKMGTDFMRPFAAANLIDEIHAEQQKATEDDYREGMIADYVDGRDKVCIIEVWEKALNQNASFIPKPTRKESNEIAMILCSLGFERSSKPARCGDYGVQKCFYRGGKSSECVEDDEEYPPF